MYYVYQGVTDMDGVYMSETSYLEVDTTLDQAMEDDLQDAGTQEAQEDIEFEEDNEGEELSTEQQDEDMPVERTPLKFPSYFAHKLC